MTRSLAWASGGQNLRSPQPKVTSNHLCSCCRARRKETSIHVAHSDCSSAPHHDHCPGYHSRILVGAGDHADTGGHFSKPRPPRHLCRPTLWRHEPATNGRLRLLLLRVPLPVYQRYRERGGQVDSGHISPSAQVPSWNEYERCACANNLVCESRAGIHASWNRLAVCYPLRRWNPAGGIPGVLQPFTYAGGDSGSCFESCTTGVCHACRGFVPAAVWR